MDTHIDRSGAGVNSWRPVPLASEIEVLGSRDQSAHDYHDVPNRPAFGRMIFFKLWQWQAIVGFSNLTNVAVFFARGNWKGSDHIVRP